MEKIIILLKMHSFRFEFKMTADQREKLNQEVMVLLNIRHENIASYTSLFEGKR